MKLLHSSIRAAARVIQSIAGAIITPQTAKMEITVKTVVYPRSSMVDRKARKRLHSRITASTVKKIRRGSMSSCLMVYHRLLKKSPKEKFRMLSGSTPSIPFSSKRSPAPSGTSL